MKQWFIGLCVLAVSAGSINGAEAGVVIGGTRLVYDGAQREAGLSVSNPEKQVPYLVQSWVENITPSDKSKVPFVITPPLFRLDPEQENVVRIFKVGGSLPDNQESVFLLNIKSIPSSQPSESNQLQITVKAQLKLFYRPSSLKGQNADEAYKSLVFSRQGSGIKVTNPTPFYVSFYSLKVGSSVIDKPQMIAPGSTQELPISAASGAKVTWQAITDFGGITTAVSSDL